MKMKRFMSLLLVLTILLTFAACRPSGVLNEQQTETEPTGTETENPESDVTVREVELTVWAPVQDQTEGSEWLKQMQTAFEAAHPEYRITWTNELKAEGDAANSVINDPRAAADVYFFAHEHIDDLVGCGGLSVLSGDYAQQVRGDNIQMIVEAATHSDGNIYGFPVSSNAVILYYNKDVYSEEDVQSLDTMLEKGKVMLPMKLGWTAGIFFTSAGGTLFGENGKEASAGIDFGGEKGYMATRKMIELSQHPNAVCGGMGADRVVQGEVDAVFSGAWDAEWAQEAMGDRLGIVMAPKVTMDGQEYQMKVLGAALCVGVNPSACETPEKQEICMEFAAFLASEEAQLERFKLNGTVPAAKDLINDPVIMNAPVAVAALNTALHAAVFQSALPGMDSYWVPMETFGHQISTGEINLSNYKFYVNQLVKEINYPG